MELKVKVGISNRHVHLTKEVYDKLFDNDLEKRNDLFQPGEFASNSTLTIKGVKGSIENVRVLGPVRCYNQVEISASDAYKLGINPPVRKSGKLENSESITLVTKKNSITLDNCCIINERHLHISIKEAQDLGLVDNQVVKVLVNTKKSAILYANVKVGDNYKLELHIDYDDANCCLLKNDDIVSVII